MAYRANRNLERKLARVFREVIEQSGIQRDTGMLLASVDVEVSITNAGLMLVDVSSQDYLKYLYERFFLLEDFAAKQEFKDTIKTIFADFIKKRMKTAKFADPIKWLESLRQRVTVQIVN